MLIVRSLQGQEAGYYLNGPVVGRWTGAACASLGLEGIVEAAPLRRILAARHPVRGQSLLDRPGPRKRDAWGLIFAAPKSLSLLQALGQPEVGRLVAEAHQRAVDGALSHLESYGLWAGRGSARRQLIPVTGLIGGAFDHHRNVLGEPHLHTHLLVANLVQGDDGRWSAFRSGPWWAERRAAGALYQLGLRYELAQLGLRFEWDQHPNGLADVAGVPRSSIEAASRRRVLIQLDAARWTGELGQPSGRVRAVAQGRTRLESPAMPTWQERLTVTGFDTDRATRLVERARDQPQLSSVVPPSEAIARQLLEEGSTFRRADVVCAIAALSGTGALSGNTVEELADRFCAGASQLAPGRWTTPQAARLEEALGERVRRGRNQGRGRVVPDLAAAVLREVSAEEARDAIAAAWRLVTAGHSVELMQARASDPEGGRSDGCWLGQAEAIDLARRVWQAAGHRVMVLTDAPSAGRWQALTAIAPGRPEQASVLVVDRADRIPPPKLLALLEQADRQGTKVVLVDGGTAPARRWPAALTLRQWPPSLEPVPIVSSRPSAGPTGACVAAAGSGGDSPTVHVAGTGRDALASLLHAWAPSTRDPGALPPVLVGLGAAEVAVLNRAGRDRWGGAGRLHGPVLRRRGQEFQPGDVVMARRSVGAAGRSHVPAGTRGRVTTVDPDRGVLHVTWSVPDRRTEPGRRDVASAADNGRGVRPVAGRLSGDQLSRLSYGYATTPTYLRSSGEAVLVLGPPASVGRHRGRIAGAWLAAPASRRETWQSGNHLARLAGSLPPERDLPGRVGALAKRSLAELARRRQTLAVQLQAALPSRHGQHLSAATEHADQLAAWRDLGRAEAYRADLLAWSREIRATDGLEPDIGRPPETPAERAIWRRAVRDRAVFEDRQPTVPLAEAARHEGLPPDRHRPYEPNRLPEGKRQPARERRRSYSRVLDLG